MGTGYTNLERRYADAMERAREAADAAKADPGNDAKREWADIALGKAREAEEDIRQARKSDELVKSFFAMQPDDDGFPWSGGRRGGFLRLKSPTMAAKTALAMRNVGAALSEKGIGPAGEALVPIELVSKDPIRLGEVPTAITDVIKWTTRESPIYEYLRQTSRVNNAAVVAPGAPKPQSSFQVQKVQGALMVVAHLSEAVDRYLIEDMEPLVRFVEQELSYGLLQAVEREIVTGDGTTGHMTGILHTSGIQVVHPLEADPAPSRTMRAAKTALQTAGHEPSLFALSPSDWETVETFRDAENRFELGGPVDTASQKLWGVPVVVSQALPIGTALAFDREALHGDVDTMGVDVRWSQDYGTDFQLNQLRARCEGRFNISVTQPQGIVLADLVGEPPNG
jgi:HK97 family phage major capsid protein